MDSITSEALSKYRDDGYTFKYINFRWIWVIISAALCLYFGITEIKTKTAEFADLKERFSTYVDHPVEIPVPPDVANIVPVAQEEKVQPELFDYRYIDRSGSKLSKFDSLLVANAHLKSWKLYIEWDEFHGRSSVILRNPDHLILYKFSLQAAVAAKVGNSVDTYFDYHPVFKEGKIYELLTWSPSLSNIYFMHGFYLFFMTVVTFLAVPVLGHSLFSITPGLGRFDSDNFFSYGLHPGHVMYAEKLTRKKFAFRVGNMVYLV